MIIDGSQVSNRKIHILNTTILRDRKLDEGPSWALTLGVAGKHSPPDYPVLQHFLRIWDPHVEELKCSNSGRTTPSTVSTANDPAASDAEILNPGILGFFIAAASESCQTGSRFTPVTSSRHGVLPGDFDKIRW